jgi:hypothetical protein
MTSPSPNSLFQIGLEQKHLAQVGAMAKGRLTTIPTATDIADA